MSARAAVLALLSVVALAIAPPARADDEPAPSAEPRGSFAFRVERYRPAIDAEFGGAASPYALSVGTDRGWMYRLEYARELMTAAGTLELGVGAGWFQASGHGLYLDSSGAYRASGDATALSFIPLSVFAGGRLTALGRLGVPIEPYARLSLERYQWFASGTSHKTVTGATSGYAVTIGAALRLDGLDPESARTFARESGIRSTSLTLDLTRSVVDDFGSRRSWDLSDPGWSIAGGLRLGF